MKNKNIWLIPTDKPSRLLQNKNTVELLKKHWKSPVKNSSVNIYITSDEEIKEDVDQWYLDKFLNKPRNSSGSQYAEKQDVIILTTDQDLIKDGIQAIDDEFLEWFVKNPSCEKIETESLNIGNGKLGYVICKPQNLILKEEPYHKAVIEKAAEDLSLTKVDILELMRRAYNSGYNQYNIVEAGLEGKDTEENIRWILTKYQTEKSTNAKRKRNFYCGDKVDYDEQCLEQCDRCVDCTGVDYGYYDQN